MKRGIFRKVTLTQPIFLTLTAINFVRVNGRSLYIDWRMVVGGCPTPCKKGGGNVRAGNVRREYVRGEYVHEEMSGSPNDNDKRLGKRLRLFSRCFLHNRATVG